MAYQADKTRKKIVFFGDSITQQGSGPGGYITLLRQQFQDEQNNRIELLNSGVGGNKVDDLLNRMDNDIILKSPKLVVIFIGVNDVWHKMQGSGNDLARFENIYQQVLDKFTRSHIPFILCTPTAIGEQQQGLNNLDDDLDAYSDVIRNIANEEQVPLCDLRKIFINYYAQHNYTNKYTGVLTTDGVHLNEAGNRLVAQSMWEVLKDYKL